MKSVFLTLLFCLTAFFLTSEEKKDEIRPNYIGGAAGFSTGYGLSYRYWPGDLGTQIVFTPIVNSEGSSFNIGTGLFKTLHEGKSTRLFLFLAGNGTYAEGTRTIYPEAEDVQDEEVVQEDDVIQEDPVYETEDYTAFNWCVGIGPGIEIYFFKNIVLDIMFGYRFAQSNPDSGGLDGVGFTGEIALYYRF